MMKWQLTILKSALRVCLLTVLLVAQAFALESEALPISSQQASQSVSQYIYVLHDQEDNLNLEQVIAADEAGEFVRNEQDIINFGFLGYSVWVRFDLSYPEEEVTQPDSLFRYIEVATSLLDQGVLYEEQPDGSWSESRSDLTVPFDERALNHVYSVFPVTLEKNKRQRFYLRMKSDGSFYVPLTVWEPEAYSVKVANEEFVFGFFYGAMLCIAAFNFLIYLSVKDTSYLYYIAYLMSITLLFFIDLGHGVNIFDSTGTFLHKSIIGPTIWLLWIFVTSFIRQFLETENNHPVIDGWLLVIRGMGFIYLVLELFMPSTVGVLWGATITPFLVIAFPPMCVYMWRRGNMNALFFLIAWGFNMLGLTVYSGLSLGLIPSNLYMVALAPLGILSEAVLLSLALAERVKRTQKVLVDADKTAMAQLARYRSVFNNALEGIYQLSLNGKFIRVNPAMAKILGFTTPKELLAQNTAALDICYQNPESQYSCLAREHLLKEEVAFLRRGGQPAWADHSARLIFDEYGKPSHIEGTFIDVTERKKKEDAVKEKEHARVEKEIAKDTADAKSEFLANMSHEIRTPLTSIIGHSESIKSLKLTGSERENAFRTISNCSQQLLKLINDILDYSKIEAQKLDVENVDLDLKEFVAELRHTYEWQADHKGIKLFFVAHGKIPKAIKSDPTRLRQIVDSLLSNSLRYTKEGAITIVFQWISTQQTLLIKVIDTGVGISADQQQGIFDIFDQGGGGSVRKYGGVGLGLPIARQLALLLGGDLSLNSGIGAGSEFSVSIKPGIVGTNDWIDSTDLSSVAPKSSNPKAALEVPSLSGTVLLAEDNPVNQKLISKIISKTGANVEIAANGQIAVDIVSSESVDLILMDINMPVMDGLEATRIIRRGHEELPIFALTAEIDADELSKAKRAGCVDCLKKPVDRQEIYQVLEQVLAPK
ncbi:MAG: response regulator [Pseudomonadales bacterium]|nr:response regulator [Pseudomonadales bacterium]